MGKQANKRDRDYFVDGQLVKRVEKILGETTAKHPSEETVTTALLRRHREYQRKPQSQLRKSVLKAMRQVQQAQPQGQTERSQSQHAGAKRRRTESDSSDEPIDPNVTLVEVKGHNALNSSMCASYASKTAGASSAAPRRSSNETGGRGRIGGGGSRSVLGEISRSGVQSCRASRPALRFADMGGIEACLQEITELCEYPLRHPELYVHLGVEPPRGILLHGPPGCGKTMLAQAIAGELGVAFFKVAAPEIVSGMSGESEEKLRVIFEDALATAPSVIFLDEIDAITPKRETSSRGMERRIVAQLLSCMDSLSRSAQAEENQAAWRPVLVIGATNRPDALDPALRRAGRFDREICLGIPDRGARSHILRTLTSKMTLSGEIDFDSIAVRTPGFVGADLVALCKEAAVLAVNRIFTALRTEKHELAEDIVESSAATPTSVQDSAAARARATAALRALDGPLSPEQLAPLFVEMNDFEQAIGKVQPSAKREGFATVPSVTWEDVGALNEVREELAMAISEPIRCPERFEAMGLTVPAGVLLFGPPGCGKTMVAKAIANECGANFISIKGPELLNKYVGESERAVRQVFSRAQASAPCVVFFDELDALCPRRGSESGNGVSERVVNQLLTEMDGLESRRSVFVIAATNRPDIIDPAMLRPGRLDRLLYVSLPSALDRVAILKTCTRRTPLDTETIDLDAFALDSRLEGFSGADLNALVREAAVCALRRDPDAFDTRNTHNTPRVGRADFEVALAKVFPSVSVKDQKLYDRMQKRLRRARATLSTNGDETKVPNESSRGTGE